MRGTFVKRRYMESRIGAVVLNPILAAANFIMLGYITLNLSNSIPFWIFAPLFLTGMIALVTVIGFKFRKIQLSTDEDMKYEKQSDFNKTLLQIMLALDDDNRSQEFYKRMDYVKSIADNKN